MWLALADVSLRAPPSPLPAPRHRQQQRPVIGTPSTSEQMARPPIGATSGLDHPGVYQRVQQARKAVAQSDAGRVTRARVEASRYQRGKQEPHEPPAQHAFQPRVRDIPRSAVPASERKPAVRADDESAQWRYGPVGVSLGGYAGLVDERIEAARAAGAFRDNALRGKPMQRDINEQNPFLRREELLMNRIIQRQGAAPPWVEANSDIDVAINSFRNRLAADWTRHASRTMTSGHDEPSAHVKGTPLSDSAPIPLDVVNALPDSLEGVNVQALPPLPTAMIETDSDPDLPREMRERHVQPSSIASLLAQTRSPEQALDALHTYFLSRYVDSLSTHQPVYPPGLEGATLTQSSHLDAGERGRVAMLWARTCTFRDPAWEKRNEPLHAIEISDLNRKIMRYNSLAPFHARRGLLTRPGEVERALATTRARLALAVSNELRMIRSPAGRRAQQQQEQTRRHAQGTGLLNRIANWLDSSAVPAPNGSRPYTPARSSADREEPAPTTGEEDVGGPPARPAATTAVDSLLARLQTWRS